MPPVLRKSPQRQRFSHQIICTEEVVQASGGHFVAASHFILCMRPPRGRETATPGPATGVPALDVGGLHDLILLGP